MLAATPAAQCHKLNKAWPPHPLQVCGAFSIMFQQIPEILLRKEEARSLTYNKEIEGNDVRISLRFHG